MKKFLLVLFIGMVLAINLYGIANKIIEMVKVDKPVEISYTIVYEE